MFSKRFIGTVVTGAVSMLLGMYLANNVGPIRSFVNPNNG